MKLIKSSNLRNKLDYAVLLPVIRFFMRRGHGVKVVCRRGTKLIDNLEIFQVFFLFQVCY